MKVSLNTIKQFTPVDISVDELVQKINQQLGGVEEVVNLGARYEGAVIVRVAECEKHPDADKLNVCMVDDGSGALTQVVCGAPNVRPGIMAVWLKPGATVPSTANDPEPFVLTPKELRGVVSNGMLASAKELGIGDDHDGIVELVDADVAEGKSLEVGASFAETFDLNDTIIDIENKMFTHRPDLFGQLGVAREIRAILQPEPSAIEHSEQFTDDVDWYWRECSFEGAEGLELHVSNDIPELVPRLMAVALNNVSVGQSPMWLKTTLVRWASKPINNVVDLTNYIMLLTAQPTHAYDYDKLRGQSLSARRANENEQLELLNGKTYNLNPDDIVIADGEGAIGLAGIMGGNNSEVSADTTSVVLEVATFDMYAVRKSAMRHGVFTDALTRFNKGQSYLQNHRVLNRLMQLMGNIAGAQQASDVADLTGEKSIKNQESIHEPLRIDASFVNERLGVELNAIQIGNILRPAQFATYQPDDGAESEVLIHAPFWRTDIESPEDIVEEVGRLYGFDKLPRELPLRHTTPAPKNAELVLKQSIRNQLAKAGANEVLTYSFVHENTLAKVGQDAKHAFKLSNALSPDLQYYRLSVMSSLLEKVHMNYRAGYDQFALFELGKTHFKGEMDEADPSVPNEDSHLALVLTYGDKQKPAGGAYYQARNYLEQLIDLQNLELLSLSEFDLSSDEWGVQLCSAYAPKRSAVIVNDGQIWGVVGEFSAKVREAFKLPDYSAGFEVHLDILKQSEKSYRPLSRYPSTWQDISLKVDSSVSYASVFETAKNAALSAANDIEVELTPQSIYQAEGDSEHKTITLRVTLTHHDRTLKEAEASAIIEAIAAAADSELGAQHV